MTTNTKQDDRQAGTISQEARMDCDRVWDLLSVYADGEADSNETTIVVEHISCCTTCARDLEFMQGTSAAVQAETQVAPPAAMRQAILNATIYKPTMQERFASAIRRSFSQSPVRYGALATAGAAAALTLTAIRPGVTPGLIPATGVAQTQVAADIEPGVLEGLGLEDLMPNAMPGMATRQSGTSGARIRRTAIASTGRTGAPLATRAAAARNGRTMPSVSAPTGTSLDDVDLDESAAGQDEMAAVASPTMTAEPSLEPAAAPVNVPAVTATMAPRIVLAASTGAVNAGQIATLADMRKSLNRRPNGLSTADLRQQARDGQVRIDLIKGSF